MPKLVTLDTLKIVLLRHAEKTAKKVIGDICKAFEVENLGELASKIKTVAAQSEIAEAKPAPSVSTDKEKGEVTIVKSEQPEAEKEKSAEAEPKETRKGSAKERLGTLAEFAQDENDENGS